MKTPIILDVCETNSLFAQKFTINHKDTFSSAIIPRKRKYIKKFLKSIDNEKIFITNRLKDDLFFKGKVKEFNTISYSLVELIINRVCSLAAIKNSIRVPYCEIYIIASLDIAYSIILPLMDICRLFTIVSDEYDIKKADEMYFKYGCIIRHKNKRDMIEGKEKLIIYANEKVNLTNTDIPIINLTCKEIFGDNVIDIRDVKVYDSRFLPVIELWEGVPGLNLYSLFSAVPDENSEIDINIKADRIFLLDRSKF